MRLVRHFRLLIWCFLLVLHYGVVKAHENETNKISNLRQHYQRSVTVEKKSAPTFKVVSLCGKSNEGVMVKISNSENKFAYYIVNEEVRYGEDTKNIGVQFLNTIDKIPAPQEKPFIDNDSLVVELKDELQSGSVVFVEGTFENIQDEKKTTINLIKSKQQFVSLRIEIDWVKNVVILNSKDKHWNMEKRSAANPFKADKPFTIHIIALAHHYKVYANGKHLLDFQSKIDINNVSHLTASANAKIGVIKIGDLKDLFGGIQDAENYCQKNYKGHLLTFENENEKSFLSDFLNSNETRKKHLQNDIVGVLASRTGMLEAYDGTRTGYLSMLRKHDKPINHNCLFLSRWTSAERIKDESILNEWDCKKRVATFICKSKIVTTETLENTSNYEVTYNELIKPDKKILERNEANETVVEGGLVEEITQDKTINVTEDTQNMTVEFLLMNVFTSDNNSVSSLENETDKGELPIDEEEDTDTEMLSADDYLKIITNVSDESTEVNQTEDEVAEVSKATTEKQLIYKVPGSDDWDVEVGKAIEGTDDKGNDKILDSKTTEKREETLDQKVKEPSGKSNDDIERKLAKNVGKSSSKHRTPWPEKRLKKGESEYDKQSGTTKENLQWALFTLLSAFLIMVIVGAICYVVARTSGS